STSKTPSYTKSVSWQHHQLLQILPQQSCLINILLQAGLMQKLAQIIKNKMKRRIMFSRIK
ncbi:hypothetical protein P1S85_23875, partial [Escherichia coli]|nr:hypothetical protein [Escherichia coli]